MPSSRAAILTPSPIKSPSLSSTTSPKMDADTELDAALGRQASVALHHAVLHLDGATDGIDNTSELDEDAIPRALNDAAVMEGNSRVDEIAAERT
jgi:hypothetical protein